MGGSASQCYVEGWVGGPVSLCLRGHNLKPIYLFRPQCKTLSIFTFGSILIRFRENSMAVNLHLSRSSDSWELQVDFGTAGFLITVEQTQTTKLVEIFSETFIEGHKYARLNKQICLLTLLYSIRRKYMVFFYFI